LHIVVGGKGKLKLNADTNKYGYPHEFFDSDERAERCMVVIIIRVEFDSNKGEKQIFALWLKTFSTQLNYLSQTYL
jgi:hypothetical protein